MFAFAEYEQVTAYAEQRFAEVCQGPTGRNVFRRRQGERLAYPKSVRRVSAMMVLMLGMVLQAACAPESDNTDSSTPSVFSTVVHVDAGTGGGDSQTGTAVLGSTVETTRPAKRVPHPPYPVFFPTNRFFPQ